VISADAKSLREQLQRLQALRGPSAIAPPRLAELKAWQSARLTRTYADFASQPRYRAATSFFIDDLYGAKDFSRRDASMLRIFPVMTRILPATAVETAALAIELEALSEALDQATARALAPGPITDATYADAYRATSPDDRRRQIDLVVAVGDRLDLLVRKPLVRRTLRLMRNPARLAGMTDLQDFLERGFEAFRAMGGSAEFLATVRSREERILNRLFSSEADPFSA
jgi:hypothetical protein